MNNSVLICIYMCLVLVAQLCLTLQPMDCSLPGSFVHGILQARILEWVAIPFFRRSSQPRDWSGSPALQADSLSSEPLGKPLYVFKYFYLVSCFLKYLFPFSIINCIFSPKIQLLKSCCKLVNYHFSGNLPHFSSKSFHSIMALSYRVGHYNLVLL